MTPLEYLVEAGLTPESVERLREAETRSSEPLPVIVSRLGLLPDHSVVVALANCYSVAIFDEQDAPEKVFECAVTPAFLKHHRILLLAGSRDRVSVAIVDPGDTEALAGLRFATGLEPDICVIGFQTWRDIYDRLYAAPDAQQARMQGSRGARWTDDDGGLRDLGLDAPAVRLVETLIANAVDRRASDIHIERKPDGARVRYRIDGRLQEIQRLSAGLADGVLARLKVLGDLDVANHRRAQDGRTSMSARGRPIDVRLSIIPTAFGEGAVVRLLDRDDIKLDFADLGFRDEEIERLRHASSQPQGLFLVSGPTGGGKTTTLYAALNALRGTDRKILTIEDPIEYFFADVQQTQTDESAGLEFASALRAFLRHDPDVILVGEIRDPQTAATAVQASLTGHLVLSTIHANDAASVPARLIEMGVEPYLLATTLNATSAQRLVRRLCPHCKAPDNFSLDALAKSGLAIGNAATVFKPVGCDRCRDGYSGRMVISETLVFDDIVRDVVMAGASVARLKTHIDVPLKQDGLLKVAAGDTALEEVLRALEVS